jgi:uncharacterized protein YabE (DUF348 family)
MSAGKRVELKIDGKNFEYRTDASTVGEFLEENGVVVEEGDAVYPSLKSKLVDGGYVEIIKAKPVIVYVDGHREKFNTSVHRVFDLLKQLNIEVKEEDTVYPSLNSSLKAGSVVRVLRKREILAFEEKAIPFKEKLVKDPTLPKGKKVTKNPGKNGVAVLVYKYIYKGGKLVGKELVKEEVKKKPEERLIALGTAVSKRSSSYSSSSPVASSRGSGRWITVLATAYVPGHGCGTRTATGRRAQRGVVAVDPRVIPLGTRLYIPGYGYAVAADTGGSIRGYRIDLCFSSLREARRFGRRRIRVQILN